MKTKRSLGLVGLGSIAILALGGGDAWAVQQPKHLVGAPDLEVANGGPVRVHATRSPAVPRSAERAWLRLLAETGPAWAGTWDVETGVPSRLWGPGVPAPGTMASPTAAEAFARAFLERHLDVLAPGAAIDDFALAANDLGGGQRTISFVQQHTGLPVLGGQVNFRFRADRMFMIGSEALPRVRLAATSAPTLPSQSAKSLAAAWVLEAAGNAVASDVQGPFVLPLVRGTRAIEYVKVVRVTVDAGAPLGRWSVYLDAKTGERVAKKQTLLFAQDTLLFHAPVRWPGSTYADFPAEFADITIDGNSATTDANGTFVAPDGANASIVAQSQGPRVSVNNAGAAEATVSFDLAPGGTFTWDASTDSETEAQLNVFIHAYEVREYAKTFAPGLGWLNSQVDATVNINDQCNAYSDGTSINFFAASNNCENTGRLADVVYHEFGHSLHAHGIIQGVGAFEGALSEGISDYLSATITGDPAMGRGFFYTSQPLRHIDPSNGEKIWPDDAGSEPHATGLIIGGTLWDLRKALVAKLGDAEGVAQADFLFYEGIRRAVDIPTMFPEVLAADDDDGDIRNGTPNACEIAEVFGAHGLRTLDVDSPHLGVVPPTNDGFTVKLNVVGLFPNCPNDGIGKASLEWRLRSNPSSSGTIEMTPSGTELSAAIPKQAWGEVVQYKVTIELANGGSLSFPDNPADPMYEFFVGEVVPLYCTDFENDPETEGWTHGLESGEPGEGADDWMWGEPEAPADSGDPTEAYSGNRVFGNDLGGGNYNGKYQNEKVNFALTPDVATQEFKTVRLQYRRWLSVEDAHFDRATISVDGVTLWSNLDSDQGDDSQTHHRDREWRFHDVDLSAQAADGTVQVRFDLSTDQGLTMGGWTIDDVCIVGVNPAPPDPPCPDGSDPPCEGTSTGGDPSGGSGGDGATPAPGPAAKTGDVAGGGGCGCRTSETGDAHAAAALAVMALGLLARRGRRRGT